MSYVNSTLTLNNSSLSFAGCGFLGFYHVGAISCFEKHAPHMLTNTLSGASAGSLVACAVINGLSAERCARFVLDIVVEAKSCLLGSLSPSFQLDKILREALERTLPWNAHVRSSGRLFVSMTSFPDLKDVLVSHFKTREDLIQALACSCYIPFYSGLGLPKYRGRYYFDGGFTNNLPSVGQGAIKVSPFAGENGICPNDGSKMTSFNVAQMNTQASLKNVSRMTSVLFPQDLEECRKLCQSGYTDTLAFLRKKGYMESPPSDLGFELVDYEMETSTDEILPKAVDEVFNEAIRRHGKGSSLGSKILTRVVAPAVYPGSCAYSFCQKVASWMMKPKDEEKEEEDDDEGEQVPEDFTVINKVDIVDDDDFVYIGDDDVDNHCH